MEFPQVLSELFPHGLADPELLNLDRMPYGVFLNFEVAMEKGGQRTEILAGTCQEHLKAKLLKVLHGRHYVGGVHFVEGLI
ncbi:hypothetical protein D9M68_984070 [compost metagenome]